MSSKMSNDDLFGLDRFVTAQAPLYDDVLAELRAGRKETHWMWFVFPQLRGLGRSWMAEKFGISGKEEAQAYLAHPILGPRLTECVRLVKLIEGRSAQVIFGPVDAMKFRSSMTLFAAVAEEGNIFRGALTKYFDGRPDPLTVAAL